MDDGGKLVERFGFKVVLLIAVGGLVGAEMLMRRGQRDNRNAVKASRRATAGGEDKQDGLCRAAAVFRKPERRRLSR